MPCSPWPAQPSLSLPRGGTQTWPAEAEKDFFKVVCRVVFRVCGRGGGKDTGSEVAQPGITSTQLSLCWARTATCPATSRAQPGIRGLTLSLEAGSVHGRRPCKNGLCIVPLPLVTAPCPERVCLTGEVSLTCHLPCFDEGWEVDLCFCSGGCSPPIRWTQEVEKSPPNEQPRHITSYRWHLGKFVHLCPVHL